MKVNQYKAGAALSYVSILLTNVIGLVLTPFIIRSLGNAEYGLYSLIGSFVAYLSLMDLGLNNTIVRFVSKYRAEKDGVSEQKFLGTTMLIYAVISVLVLLIGMVMYLNLGTIFSKSLDATQLAEARVMFLILMFNIAFMLPGGSFTAIFNAYERFVFPRSINILRYLLRAATVFAVLSWGGKAISLVVIDTVFNIVVALISFYYVKTGLKVRFDYSKRNWGAVKPILGYSVWIFLIAITQYLQWNAGQLVLGINTDTVQVAVFAVGVMLGTYYGAFAGAINNLLLPKANQMVVNNSSGEELTTAMIRVARLSNMVSFFILGGFILLGKEFITLWVGDTYKDSWIVALLIMLASTIPLSQSFGMSVLEAKNRVRFKSLFNLGSLICGVVIGFFLSRQYGLIGMSISLCTAMVLNSLAVNLYFVNVFGFQLYRFFKESYFMQILVLSFFILAMQFVVKAYVICDSWLGWLTVSVIYLFLFMGLTMLLLEKNERSWLVRKSSYR